MVRPPACCKWSSVVALTVETGAVAHLATTKAETA